MIPTALIPLQPGDALLIVDLQRDFLPGGALGVPGGDEVVPMLNHCLALFERARLPVVLTRDWHPGDHVSFAAQGGPWPPHCVAGTPGAAFAPDLAVPDAAQVVSKATLSHAEAYSGFEGTPLADMLRSLGCRRIWIGGLATDYCVRATVLAALARGLRVSLLTDAVAGVNVQPGDADRAIEEMVAAGAQLTTTDQVTVNGPDQGQGGNG